MNNREKGSLYEEAAARLLIEEGCSILARNYRRKTGEIDIIARDQKRDCLVFAEVKYRKSHRTGFPEEAVTAAKQQRIYRTAQWYLNEFHLPETTRCSFDVISVSPHGAIRIHNAFGGF